MHKFRRADGALHHSHRARRGSAPRQCRHRSDHSQTISPEHRAHRVRSSSVLRLALRDRWRPQAGVRAESAGGSECIRAACRANFGRGSSREHAAWALADFGFRCIIAESFGDIFQANCSQNGILPVSLPSAAVHELFRRCAGTPGYELSIDLESQLVRDRQGFAQRFDIDPYRRAMLLSGQDEIGKTLMLEDRIAAFEQRS